MIWHRWQDAAWDARERMSAAKTGLDGDSLSGDGREDDCLHMVVAAVVFGQTVREPMEMLVV